MTPEGESNIRILSAEQSQHLLDVHHDLPRSLGPSGVARRCVRLLGDIFSAKVALAIRRRGTWTVLAESAPDPQFNVSDEGAGRVFDETVATPQPRSWRHADLDWTLVGLRDRPNGPVILVIEGDWTLSTSTLMQLAQKLKPSTRLAARSPRHRVSLAAHRLTRALGRAQGLKEVSSVVLNHFVRAVPSRLAALAVPADDKRLTIVATHGYPVGVVENVRIIPGSGVIGSVYRSGTPLHVTDVTLIPGLRRRPRYRTNSFLALPVTAGTDVLGVVCVTDRLDDAAFTVDDLSALSALAAPAALALGREEARQQAQTFAHAAVVDPVSGLFNRRYFHHRLDEELHRAQRHKVPVALLLVDIDDFKSINDRFGHIVGDAVIRDVSDIIRRSVRVFDVCTRFGGEEFGVVMPGSQQENGASVAERIRRRIEEHRLAQRELEAVRVTVSIGLSISDDGSASARDLIHRADLALYAAKREGKNRVATSGPPFPS